MISLVLLFKHHWVFCWKMASPAKVFLPGRIYKNDMPLPQFAEECLQVLQAPELLGERPHPAGELLQHLGQSGLHCHTPSVSARAKTASHPFPASVELSSSPYYTTSVSWGSCFSPSPFGMIKQTSKLGSHARSPHAESWKYPACVSSCYSTPCLENWPGRLQSNV